MTRIHASRPEVVCGKYLRALRKHDPEHQDARSEQIEAALAALAQRVVAELATVEFWNRNASHSSDVVNLALTVVGTPTIEQAVRSALDDPQLAAPVLAHAAPVIDRIDLMTGEHQATVATYGSTRWVPGWLPTSVLADAIVTSELHQGDDDTARLASEFLAALEQIRESGAPK